MFNRHLQVRVVKDDKKPAPTEQEVDAAVKTITRAISSELTQLGRKAIGGVLIYVAADTVRKVLVAHASK